MYERRAKRGNVMTLRTIAGSQGVAGQLGAGTGAGVEVGAACVHIS